jgi:hypothetical protein
MVYGGKSDKTKEARSNTPLGFSRAFFLANNEYSINFDPVVPGPVNAQLSLF